MLHKGRRLTEIFNNKLLICTFADKRRTTFLLLLDGAAVGLKQKRCILPQQRGIQIVLGQSFWLDFLWLMLSLLWYHIQLLEGTFGLICQFVYYTLSESFVVVESRFSLYLWVVDEGSVVGLSTYFAEFSFAGSFEQIYLSSFISLFLLHVKYIFLLLPVSDELIPSVCK